MTAAATYLQTGFFTPIYHIASTLITPDTELVEACRANALFDTHRDDPEFGYRYQSQEAGTAGEPMAERTTWRICTDNRWWTAIRAT